MSSSPSSDASSSSDEGAPWSATDDERQESDPAAADAPYFDVEELDEEEQNLLVFMCFCSFLDWQDRFLDAYKEVLVNRGVETRSTAPSESYALYTSLRETVLRQRGFLKGEGENTEDGAISDDESVVEESSVFRTWMRAYRLEFYLKIMMLIFLLKLPATCYLVVTGLYVVYIFTSNRLASVMQWPIFNGRLSTQVRGITGRIYRTTRRLLPFVNRTDSPRPAATTSTSTTAASRRDDPVSTPSPQPSSAELVPTETRSTTTRRRGPSYLTKVCYQLVAAYVLSLMPWWEPNPRYLQESD
ncbi:hypothetical protein, conserved [Babesia ovata]|uniref:Uncharacterized protein n=1 Tax=Babesia ovata TaxID=189622 RepID=A0A2H6K9R1_9APIC|nr:uncharacterized protein BOVATA_011820 [Babesia ovata]GBE59689.1 hypothetical protein, conserved [Babesia ovata]